MKNHLAQARSSEACTGVVCPWFAETVACVQEACYHSFEHKIINQLIYEVPYVVPTRLAGNPPTACVLKVAAQLWKESRPPTLYRNIAFKPRMDERMNTSALHGSDVG